MIEVGKVGMIPTDADVVSNRAREVMGNLDTFEDNLKESGLISPLAVKDNLDGTYLLLAGERRLTILRKNDVPEIPVRIYEEDLTPMQMKIIEKSENFHRKDMEYWEFDKLTLEIHEMQQSIHGVKAPGPGDGWGQRDTAELLGHKSPSSVTEAVKRAQAREALPDLFESCKTQSDASKILSKIDEAAIKATIAQELEKSKPDATLDQLSKCFILRDFFEGVKEIPDGIMHLVEIDPPYAINLQEAKKTEGESQYTLEDYNEVDKGSYEEFIFKVLTECYRVMTEHSWLLLWFAPEPWFNVMYKTLQEVGFSTTRMCPIWTKPSGQSKRPEMHLPNSYEMFFYAWKGRPAIAKARGSNQFDYSPVPANQKTHPTERPIELMADIYETFAFPGSRILIPFLGSGNGLIAASQLGMSPVGFELEKVTRIVSL